jgi:pteridine reductase
LLAPQPKHAGTSTLLLSNVTLRAVQQPSVAGVAFVTGGAVRIGAAIVDALVRAGYRVWIHHHRSGLSSRPSGAEGSARPSGAEGAQAEGPGAIVGTLAADLLDEDDRQRACATVLAPDGPAAGRLDLLVNNAASFERGAFVERTDADLRRVLELNLVAPLSLTRACAGALRRSGGSVVNILDVGGEHPWPDHLDHCTSKAALHLATRALAVELAPVRVNGVAPGTVAWPQHLADDEAARRRMEAGIPLGRIGSPADVAAAVVFLASAAHVTGQVLAVDGGRLAGIAGRHG